MIQALDDAKARELIARLCRAELREQRLPESSVTWGGDQRAPDGGVDVRVACPAQPPNGDFLKTADIVLQVKAEPFPPAKIKKEMLKQGAIRPAIADLSGTQGTYIIASTRDNCSPSSLQERRKAIHDHLHDHGLQDSIRYDFYDSRRIADWVEKYPAVATWLRHTICQEIKGWQPYGPWAYCEMNLAAEYLIDERVKVFLPRSNESRSISDAIRQIRQELTSSVSIRIVGLSGVGKTRLVQALFDERVCEDSPAPSSDNVLYTDLSNNPNPQPVEMLENLRSIGSDERLLRALDEDKCPVGQFAYLASSRAPTSFSIAQSMELATKLVHRNDRGLNFAFDFLGNLVDCAKDRDEQYHQTLGRNLLAFFDDLDWGSLRDIHWDAHYHLESTLDFALKTANSELEIKSILNELSAGDDNWIRFDDIRRVALRPFFLNVPEQALDIVCVPEDDGKFSHAIELLSGGRSIQEESALALVPAEILVDWCNQAPVLRFPFAAHMCRLFERNESGDDSSALSETAKAIFAAASEKEPVLREFIARLEPSSYYGSRAGALERRLPMLDELSELSDDQMKVVIAEKKVRVQKQIEEIRADEHRSEQNRNERFE